MITSAALALVPRVYVRLQPGDIDGAGSLLAGRQVNINLTGDMTNTGTVAGRDVVRLSGQNINNLGGRINANVVGINAKVDLNNIGGAITAGSQLVVTAGRDINNTSTTRSALSTLGANSFSRTHIDRVAGLYVSGTADGAGTLVASAGRDINVTAGVISNNAKNGATSLAAARDINLGTVTTASSNRLVWDPKNTRSDAATNEVGSTVNSQGSLTLQAGNDITARAASLQAGTALTAIAANNITLTAGQDTQQVDEAHQSKSKGLLSSTTRTSRDTLESTTAAGSTLGGNTVVLSAGNNLTVRGSEVIGDKDATLIAKNNLTIEAAQNTSSTTSFRSESKSGLFSNGGLSVTIGKKQSSTDEREQTSTAAASTVGSINGNVNLIAGQTFRQVGSDVLAPAGDINIQAKNVEIVEARETSASQTETKSKQSGLTVALSNPVLSAVQGAASVAQAAKNTSSGRAKGLAAASVGLTGYTAYNGLTDKAGNFDASKAADINVSVSIGSSKSQSNSASTSNTARGSTVNAGNNVNITATGAGKDSNILIQGSDIKAGNNASLTADNQINLLAAKNESSQTSTNSSSSGSIGMSLGSNTGVTLAASKGKGKSDGQGTSYTNSRITAGNTASLTSGGNTTVKGAVVAANQIKADVGQKFGGDLTIESLQDTNTYTSSQKSVGGSITIGPGGVPTGGSISAIKSNINSNFQSVNEQSGFRAGDGGFQVSVANNTSLTGGVISSSQTAVDGKANTFTTGGQLTITDVQNTASYKGKGYNITASISTGTDKKTGQEVTTPGGSAGIGSDSGSAASTSSGGISGIAGNQAVRTGDAQTGIKPIFDADKVSRRIDAEIKITAAFGQQASKAIGDYAATQMDRATDLRIAAGKLPEGDAERARLTAEANTIDAKWGDNGYLRGAAHIAVGGLTGGANGALGAGVGTFAAPLVAGALADAGITGPLATIITAFGSTAASALAGGTSGAMGGFNEVVNNYLTPRENLARNKAASSCAASNYADSKSCGEAAKLNALDVKRDKEIAAAVADCKTSGSQETCNSANRMVNDLQNKGMTELRQLAVELAPTCPPPRDCAQAANWGTTELSTLYGAGRQLWPYVASGGVEGTAGPVEAVAGGVATLPRVGLGFVLASGFDAAGQYALSGTIRPEQSLFAGATGGAALPLTVGRNWIVGAGAGAVTGGVNTTFNNWMYDENTSVWLASGLSGIAGGLGVGAGASVFNSRSYTPVIPMSGSVSTIPIKPPVGAPYAIPISNGAGNFVGSLPSFVPLSPNAPPQPKDGK